MQSVCAHNFPRKKDMHEIEQTHIHVLGEIRHRLRHGTRHTHAAGLNTREEVCGVVKLKRLYMRNNRAREGRESRKEGREGEREGGREGEREGERKGETERVYIHAYVCIRYKR